VSLMSFCAMVGCPAARCLVASAATVRQPASSNPVPTRSPSWPDNLTAIGTIALAILTLATLVATILISRHGDRQLRNEHKETEDRERLAEATSIQILGAATTIVINHGRYTINEVTAMLKLHDGSLVEFKEPARILSVEGIAAELNANQALQFERTSSRNMLTPWDAGLRFDADPAKITRSADAYPIVRWQDRWDNYWQYCHGQVQRIGGEDDPWSSDPVTSKAAATGIRTWFRRKVKEPRSEARTKSQAIS
jgi:hypothetical protein